MATTPECEYIGGHRDGYDDECAWCHAKALRDRQGELEPRHVAAVDQGEALVAEALSTYVANYTGLVERLGDTKALLALAAQISADAHRGARGMDGLASLAAVAIAQLAAMDRARTEDANAELLRQAPVQWPGEPYPGVARTLPCGCGYNAAGAQCCVGIGCHGAHTSATVQAHTRCVECQGLGGHGTGCSLDATQYRRVEQVEPWHGKVALDREYTDEELRASPYTEIMRDAVVVGPDEYRPAVEQVEPWHGKATFTGDDGRDRIVTIGRPRCSRCYGVGHYASDCTVGL